MLARAGDLPPDDGTWALEMKWDGLRALTYLESGRLRLVSRRGQDITPGYPELAALAQALAGHQVLLDGEIVVLTGGWPDFESVQRRMNAASAVAAARLAVSLPVTYLAFDVLHLDGRPLLALPYARRRALLEDLRIDGARWQTPPSFTDVPAADVQEVSLRHGLEGVMAKRLHSRYEPGLRSGNWRKIKNQRHQEVVIGGWHPGEGGRAGQIGSLLVGVHEPGGLGYAGHVGTGFSQQTLDMLSGRLAPLRRGEPPFTTPVPPAHARKAIWVEPVVVIEVVFAGWTRAGRLRAPSYRGLRTDKDPAQVTREPSAGA